MQESLVLEMLETGKTATWPANSGTQQGDEFVEKEVKGVPSTDRTKRMKERFMNAKCKMDMEAPIAYTKAWREYEGKPLYVRRGLSFKYRLSARTSSSPCPRPAMTAVLPRFRSSLPTS